MAFNEDTSFIEYPVDQPTQDFVTNFDTIGGTTDVVLVTVDGVLTDTPESSYTVQQINHTTWRVTPEVQTGSVVRLYRVTNIDEMMHVFTAGAKFIARNMDNNFKQIRHAQQEVRDGFNKLSIDTNEIIDTLQVVGEAAQDAANAAEAAAQTANDAAAQVNDKVSYQDLDAAVDDKVMEVISDGVDASSIIDVSGETQQAVNLILGSAFFVEMWGAKGDDVTNDSAAIQSAINDLSAKFLATGQEQTLLFSGSKTYVCRQIALKAGVHYQGVNGRARIKKTPAGAITDETVLKWWRIFSVSQNEASFNSNAARKVRHRFANLIFDGNRDNMNWSGGYAQEQAASLFLTGNISSMLTAADQRNKFQVDNCLFPNSVADGIGIWYNADVIVNGQEAINCFRGGLVASGGNTIVTVNGYTSTNARIDFEVDAAGYGGTHKFDWNLSNVSCDKHNPNPVGFNGADLCVADGGRGVGNNVNIYSTPVNFNGRGLLPSNSLTKLEFSNCLFYIRTETAANYIYPCNTDFNSVEFVAANSSSSTLNGLGISWAVNGAESIKNKVLNFNDCVFSHLSTVSTEALSVAVNSQRITNQSTGNVMRFRNCSILSPFKHGVVSDGLVKIDWDGGGINAITAFRSTYAYNAAAAYLRIGNYLPLSNNVRMLETNTSNGSTAVNELEFAGTTLPLDKSAVLVQTGAGVTGRVDKKLGSRTILSDTPPVAIMSAYNGDVLRLNTVPVNGPYEWVCTTANFSNTANTWKPIKWNVGSFTTATLPVLTPFDVGVQSIDTTLNKVVTWAGSAWV